MEIDLVQANLSKLTNTINGIINGAIREFEETNGVSVDDINVSQTDITNIGSKRSEYLFHIQPVVTLQG